MNTDLYIFFDLFLKLYNLDRKSKNNNQNE